MGGGSLMTPILILLFGMAPTTAVGSDIAYAAVTKTVGGWRHFRLRTGERRAFALARDRKCAGRDRRRLGDLAAARCIRRGSRRHRPHDARDRESFELTRTHKIA